MPNTQISTIMTRNVVCTEPSTRLAEACALMSRYCYSCLMIARHRNPIGIITERDVVRVYGRDLLDATAGERPVEEFMSNKLITAHSSANVLEALVITQSQRVRHLPIVAQDETLVGLVTYSDLARAHMHMLEVQRIQVEKAVRERTQDLEMTLKEFQAMALEDGLLGIGNRRAMEIDLAYTHHSAKRYYNPYALLIINIDAFTQYQQSYSLQAADRALQNSVAAMRQVLRESDRLYRYDSEKFFAILPQTDNAAALRAAERIGEAIRNLAIPHGNSPLGTLSVCGGVAAFPEVGVNDLSWEAVIDRADRSLRTAQALGPDRVHAWNGDMSDTGARLALPEPV